MQTQTVEAQPNLLWLILRTFFLPAFVGQPWHRCQGAVVRMRVEEGQTIFSDTMTREAQVFPTHNYFINVKVEGLQHEIKVDRAAYDKLALSNLVDLKYRVSRHNPARRKFRLA